MNELSREEPRFLTVEGTEKKKIMLVDRSYDVVDIVTGHFVIVIYSNSLPGLQSGFHLVLYFNLC